MLRVQLYNSFVGNLVINRNDPIDINNTVKNFRRSKEYFGVFFDIVLDFSFIEEGRQFVKKSFEIGGGIDAVTLVTVYKFNPDTYKWGLYYNGKVNYNKYDRSSRLITVTLEQAGIDRTVLNGMEDEIDMEAPRTADGLILPDQTSQESLFHSKKILVEFGSTAESGTVEYQSNEIVPSVTGDVFITFPFLEGTISDIEEYASLEFGAFPVEFGSGENAATDLLLYRWKIKDAGAYNFKFSDVVGRITTIKTPDLGNQPHSLKLMLTHGRAGDYSHVEIGSVTNNDGVDLILDDPDFDVDIDLKVGDEVYIYYVHSTPGYTGVLAEWEFFSEYDSRSLKVDIAALTEFPETSVKNIMIHECFDRAIAYLTGETGLFYSDLLGRVELDYDEDGEYSLLALTCGKWLRGRIGFYVSPEQISQKTKMFFSLQSLIRFINSITPVGFGFENVNGKRVFRLEKITHFFDKNNMSVSLGTVQDPEASLVSSMFHNRVISGYSEEVDIKLVNGIDAFNTLREYKIPVKNSKTPLDISTEVNTDGHIIEAQRRLTKTTEDSTYDDKNFGVMMERDGDDFIPRKLFTPFETAVNVISPSTGYNYVISPRSNLNNWSSVLAASLVKSFNKVLRFASGTVNYVMGKKSGPSQPFVYENSDLDLTNVQAIWEPDMYKLVNVEVTDAKIKLIEDNPYYYIEFKDEFGEVFHGFLMPGENSVVHYTDKNLADFLLLKVNRT